MIISFNLKFYKVSFLIRFSYISKLSASLLALSDSQFWPICVLMASKFNNCFPDQTKLNFISFIRRFVSSSLYTSGQSKYFVSIFQTKLLSVASTDRPNDRMDERLLGFNSDICWILCLQNEIVVVNLIKTNDGYGYTTIKTTALPHPLLPSLHYCQQLPYSVRYMRWCFSQLYCSTAFCSYIRIRFRFCQIQSATISRKANIHFGQTLVFF